jgi:tetratricopeptide (TPR) repeat protein
MRTGKKITFVVIFLVALGASIWLQNMRLAKVPMFLPYRDSLYVPRQQVAEMVALGYRTLFADLLWLRAIQAFGAHFQGDQDYRPILHLFNTITDLDPHFIDAYLFGNMVVGEEMGDQKKGLELLDKGIEKNPRTYRLPYWAGYVCVWGIGDLQRAKYYYRLALKAPDCPSYVARILGYVELKSGRFRIAYEKYVEDLLRTLDDRDTVVEGITQDRIRDVIRSWVLSILNETAQEYRERNGKDISQLSELEALLREKTVRVPFFDKLTEAIDQQSRLPGKLLPHLQEIIDKSFGTLDKIPEEPFGYFYYIVPGKTSKDKGFIGDAEDVVLNLKFFLSAMRKAIEQYKEKHGTYPPTIDAIFGEPLKQAEPFGGKWLYDPRTGEFRSSTLPRL